MNFLSFGKFSQIEYKRMDFAAVKRCLRILIRQFERAEDFECAEKALLGIERLMSEVHTNATVCSIRHTVNTADVFYESEMKFINKSLVMMMGVSKRYTKCLLRTPYRKQFSDKYGEVIFKNAEADYRLSSLKIIPLLLKALGVPVGCLRRRKMQFLRVAQAYGKPGPRGAQAGDGGVVGSLPQNRPAPRRYLCRARKAPPQKSKALGL